MSGATSIAEWVDVDNDGDLDLFIVTFSSNKLFKNGLKQSASGTVSFVAQTSEQAGTIVGDSGSPVHAAWGDWDNDGDMDCYVSHSGGLDRLYVNDGTGFFTTSNIFGDGNSGATYDTSHSTSAAAWADINNDG